MKYTKEQLVKAIWRYNIAVLNNPSGFEEIDNTRECAEAQVDQLLTYVE